MVCGVNMETIIILLEFAAMVVIGIAALCIVGVIAACVIGGHSDAHLDE
jgi:hypothetical protein